MVGRGLGIARRNLVRAGLALVFVALGLMVVAEFQGFRHQLTSARRDNQILAQQVRDLGGVPKVTPAPGPTGPAGSPGVSGQPGSAGASGRPGAAGSPGSTGKAGPAGTSGSTGPSGATGAQGAAGPKGDPGATGPAGKDGTDGTDGKDGSPGPACPTGYHLTTETVVTSGGPQQAALCEPDGSSP